MNSDLKTPAESLVVFDRHMFTSYCYEYRAAEYYNFHPRPGFAYQSDESSFANYSTLRDSDLEQIREQLDEGKHLAWRDLCHFGDDDSYLLEYAISKKLVDETDRSEFIKITLLHLSQFRHGRLGETMLRMLVERNVSLLEITEKLALEFEKDVDELSFDLNSFYKEYVKESLSRKAERWGKAKEHEAKVKI